MTRFFVILFVLCLLVTGGAWYWKTNFPDGDEVAFSAPGTTRSAEEPADGDGVNESVSVPKKKTLAEEAKRAVRKASRTQDLASMVSLICSILSGVGAVVSAYFSYLRYRHQKRVLARR